MEQNWVSYEGMLGFLLFYNVFNYAVNGVMSYSLSFWGIPYSYIAGHMGEKERIKRNFETCGLLLNK